jgi:hypothetical protein
MALSTNLLKTVADCDGITKLLDKDKGDLEFRKISLGRQTKQYAQNAVEVEAELAAVNTELDSLASIIAGLPAGERKREEEIRKQRTIVRKMLLEERKNDYGVVALIEREVELDLTERHIAAVTEALAAVATRKAAL